jgi:pimeloyl-ACP methyl ester carboxylesterase
MSVCGFPVHAVLHASPMPGPPSAVVVHVHALGVEQITLHRQQVLSARLAAAAGIPVLRYHARGHGDSAMSPAEVTLTTLVEDARAAADEAKRRTGCTRVLWLGVRMGALVAALAGGSSSGRDDTAGFVLWEPVEQPAEFFRQQLRALLFSRIAGGKQPDATVDQLLARLQSEGSLDVFGYTLPRGLVESFAEASLASALAGVRAPVCLAQVQSRARLAPEHVRLVEALGSTDPGSTPDLVTALVQDEPGYQFMSNPAWQSDALLRITQEWLDALA